MAYPTESERSRLRQCIGTPIETGWINDDFARYWAEICAIPTSFITEVVRRAQAQGLQLAGSGSSPAGAPDDQACIDTLANIFYRAVYYKEVR
jgi:hypothetical protein